MMKAELPDRSGNCCRKIAYTTVCRRVRQHNQALPVFTLYSCGDIARAAQATPHSLCYSPQAGISCMTTEYLYIGRKVIQRE